MENIWVIPDSIIPYIQGGKPNLDTLSSAFGNGVSRLGPLCVVLAWHWFILRVD